MAKLLDRMLEDIYGGPIPFDGPLKELDKTAFLRLEKLANRVESFEWDDDDEDEDHDS